ncbi:uncharacterized protein FOMMEDRAFT_156447 [Fomitiporia mediterranea MF3/22]|uniref:uncharacterized protein n=1 Tax=Fomitiporia mediterranea (strain MF3/22) TaxID=694068 RepID=UPI0004409522|nr:uncharacterized protein FOMMEDRAFT_156447 [Fomitiporia mediterranea MF3/22]EJD03075.1 hypothetical protein FOMMEDRAFT_156447 [Fomitiporia mediterranea MF3/22]
MSDKGEIDELESDYGDAEEYDSKDPNVFQIRDPLPPPSASVYTTQELHQLIHEGHVDLSPPYQRAVVWSREKQITLIESIFRNFYIPPVLFFVRPESDDPDLPLRVCMDGKQRLSSIQAFFDGQIPYRDPVTKKMFYYTLPSTQTGKKLLIPQKFKQDFSSRQITCVEFRGIEPAIERDIFQRVQLGVALTAAEKIAAISSPYADWITELDNKHIRGVDDGLNVVIRWDASRGKHFLCIAQLAYCCENLPRRTDPTTQKITAWLHRVDAPGEQFKQEMDQVLSKYWLIANSDELNQAFTEVKQIVAPVEFVFIGVLIGVLQNCSDSIIAEEVLGIRQTVRAVHKDVRANKSVATTLWDYIEQAAKRRGINMKDLNSTAVTNGTSNGKKRRRDAGDDEYRSTPIKSLGANPKTRSRAGK